MLQVRAIDSGGIHHERIGTAIARPDGTIAVYLDAPPLQRRIVLCADEPRSDDCTLPPIPRSRDGATGARLLSLFVTSD